MSASSLLPAVNRLLVIFAACFVVSMPVRSHANSLQSIEKALKTAEAKLACCYTEASQILGETTRGDSLLKQSQAAWEKYRDATVAFEVGDARMDTEVGKESYARIRLRITNERIEALRRFFDYALCCASEIRVRNGSDVTFKAVVVGDKNYGDLKAGETTKYEQWKVAYRYDFVSLTVDSKPFKIQPIDFTGETPLGEGKFTYVLTIEGDRLEIRPVKDEK